MKAVPTHVSTLLPLSPLFPCHSYPPLPHLSDSHQRRCVSFRHTLWNPTQVRTLAGPNDLKAPSSVMAHWWYIPLFISVCRPVYCVTVAASSFLLELAPKIYYCSCLLQYNGHPQKFIIFHFLVCTRSLGRKMQTHYSLAFQHAVTNISKYHFNCRYYHHWVPLAW